jgi:uncharacterized protein YjiS (DUF1127 family)
MRRVSATRFHPSAGGRILFRGSFEESTIMITINMLRSSSGYTATTVAAVNTAAAWLDGAWTSARHRLSAIGVARRALSLSDRLLRDIGENRAELEYEALFWPIRPPREYLAGGPISRRP